MKPKPFTYQDLSPELRAHLESQPDFDKPFTYQSLTPEFRAHLESQPDFDPADYTTGPDDPDGFFAHLEGRPIPRGYKGRRVAVIRGIGPHVALYYLLGGLLGAGGLLLLGFILQHLAR